MQKDSEVSKTRGKVFPRERPPLVIETVSKEVPVAGASNSTSGSETVRHMLITLPRVKWLERPDVA